MSFSLLPRAVLTDLTKITPEGLTSRGIRYLLMDFDNTIVPYGIDEPTQAFLSWLNGMRQGGITLLVLSNSKKPRVPDFCEKYGLACVTRAKKPFSRGFRRAEEQGIDLTKAALVGDQIFTDVLGANRQGVYSILVRPIAFTNPWLALRYCVELPFIFLGKLVYGHGSAL